MSMGGGAWEAGRTMDRSWVQCVTLTALRVASNLTELAKKHDRWSATTRKCNDLTSHNGCKKTQRPCDAIRGPLQITDEKDIWSISTVQSLT